jgi:hypothetical protein
MKTFEEQRHSSGRAILWWLALTVFGVSLLLPIESDWSQFPIGGWYAYLMGLWLAPTMLAYVPGALVLGGPGDLSRQALIEVLFSLSWFANPLCHVAALLLYPSLKRRPGRVVPLVLTGLAFGLAVLAGALHVPPSYRSLPRSPAYFAWVASMALLLVLAFAGLAARPRDDGREKEQE